MKTLQYLDAARNLSDRAESTSGLGSLLTAFLTHGFVGEILLTLTIVLTVLLVGCAVWMFRMNRYRDRRESTYQQDLGLRNQQIQMLQHRINSFEEARTGYTNLITNMSFVIGNVNFRQNLGDLANTLSSLVKNILQTDVAEFYTFDPEDRLLKRVDLSGLASKSQALSLGQGLVGAAAKDRMILTTDHFNREHLDRTALPRANRKLWMAAPILFEKQLLGVIAVGVPKRTNGTEKDLLGLVARIAGVVLYHQSFLIRAKRNADTDVLTGLHNRRYFYRMARRFVEQATQKGVPIAILLLDLDHFKHYNDTNGHDEGDRLLIEFGGLLRGCMPEDAVVARYGGEEFIVMLPSVSTEEALRYAEYLRNAVVRHPFALREKQPFGFISVSGGIASFPDHGRSIQEVVRLADASLYKAKEAGRNRISAHESCLFVGDESQPISFVGGHEKVPIVELPGETA